jgi:hypothetical protein
MSDPFDAILATLLPGEGPWPSAGTLGLAAALRADLGADDVVALEQALPPGFATLAAPSREDLLRSVETAQADLFDRLVTAAYTAYYVDPRVRAVIERETGYENRPPQPLGYELEPFDEALLEKQKQRAPFWRKA